MPSLLSTTLNFFDPHSGQIGQALRPFVKLSPYVHGANTIIITTITIIAKHLRSSPSSPLLRIAI
jgi:hypothetical protein